MRTYVAMAIIVFFSVYSLYLGSYWICPGSVRLTIYRAFFWKHTTRNYSEGEKQVHPHRGSCSGQTKSKASCKGGKGQAARGSEEQPGGPGFQGKGDRGHHQEAARFLRCKHGRLENLNSWQLSVNNLDKLMKATTRRSLYPVMRVLDQSDLWPCLKMFH